MTDHSADDELIQLPFDEAKAAEIEQALAKMQTENFKLSEQLQNVELMLDSRGWHEIYEHGSDGGLTLSQVKAASRQLRELVVGNPFIRRGFILRSLYVHGGGMEFTSLNASGSAKKKPSTSLAALIKKPSWQRYLLSADARTEAEKAAYTDGNYYVLGTDSTKQVQRLSIEQITADLRNPNNTEEIWAYRREWSPNPQDSNTATMVRWYYTDYFEGKRPSTVNHGGQTERVDTTKTLIDTGFNRQIGWAYGVPDSLGVISWAKLYRDFMVNGYVMSRALAQFAFQMTVKTQSAANASAMSVARPGESGSTFVGADQIAPLTTAGKGYDFGSGLPLLAAVAAGLDVSTSELSDSGIQTTQENFSAPGRGMAALRRKSWDEFYRRLFSWAGDDKVGTVWQDLDDAQVQRSMQAATLAWNTGLFEGDVIQNYIADKLKMSQPGEVPTGVMLPNNKESLNRADIDADGNPVSPTDPAAGSTKDDPGTTGKSGATAGTGQGQGGKTKSKPAGTAGGSLGNDHTTD